MSLSSGFNDKSQLHILEILQEGSWQEDIIIKSGEKVDAITSICPVDTYLWIGDNAGFIHAFEYNSFSMVFSYKMEPDLMEEPSPVRSIHYLQSIKRVSFDDRELCLKVLPEALLLLVFLLLQAWRCSKCKWNKKCSRTSKQNLFQIKQKNGAIKIASN